MSKKKEKVEKNNRCRPKAHWSPSHLKRQARITKHVEIKYWINFIL